MLPISSLIGLCLFYLALGGGPIYYLLQYSLKDKEVIIVFLVLPEECTFLIMVLFFAWSHFEFWDFCLDTYSGTNSYCEVNISAFHTELRPFFLFQFLRGLFLVSTCIEASGVDFTAPVINLRAWFCITSSLFKIAGVAVINASQPYCRAGFLHSLQNIFIIN
jgi:hypothetical protein